MRRTSTLDIFFEKLWENYIYLNPRAKQIYHQLTNRENEVINDHIALRTFSHPRVNLDKIKKPFLDRGYIEKDHYNFKEKKLSAKYFQHPHDYYPKIFISELLLSEFSSTLVQMVERLVENISFESAESLDFFTQNRPWSISYKDYCTLHRESNYAAWVSAFGFRANHFTVFVNALESFSDLRDLNSFLKDHGFKLNLSGGEIKGSKKVFLEQSSTLAEKVPIVFSDGTHSIPACYYEFAQRYPLASGKLYQGFVPKSADKIFESTDNKRTL